MRRWTQWKRETHHLAELSDRERTLSYRTVIDTLLKNFGNSFK